MGMPPPDGSAAEAARSFNPLLDGSRIHQDLGFRPLVPRLADATAAAGPAERARPT